MYCQTLGCAVKALYVYIQAFALRSQYILKALPCVGIENQKSHINDVLFIKRLDVYRSLGQYDEGPYKTHIIRRYKQLFACSCFICPYYNICTVEEYI